MLDITVTNKKNNNKRSYKFNQATILLGRQQNCDVILESTAISRRHAKITINKNLVEIEDLGSGNGTVINQARLSSKQKQAIAFGDTIRIEEFEIKCNFQAEAQSGNETSKPEKNSTLPPIQVSEETDNDILEIKMIKKVLGALDQEKHASINVTADNFNTLTATFEDGMDELVIGRDPECQLTINSNVVSRRHAIISVKWGGFVVTDLQSKNHTFVNGEKIKEKSIKDGDEIVFGTIKSIFKNPQEFDISAISKSIQDDKQNKTKFEDTTSFEVDDIKENDKISSAAQASTDADDGIIKPDVEPKIKEEKPAKEEKSEPDIDDLLDDSKETSDAHTKTLATKPKAPVNKAVSKFTATEIILFIFGGLVMFSVIAVLAMLFT